MQHSGPHQIVQGLYLGLLVTHLQRLRVFDFLLSPRSAADIAQALGVQTPEAACVLDYLYQSSDLLDFSPVSGYSLDEKYRDYGDFRFHIDKYVGAYGQFVDRFPDALAGRAAAPVAHDENTLAMAFDAAADRNEAIVEVLQNWAKCAVLDLGCGPGSLITSLCESNPTWTAWGVDLSPAMCRLAEARVLRAGLGARVSIVQGDCRKLTELLGPLQLATVDLVYGSSIVNEFFGSGGSEAVNFLRYLSRALPGRLFVISDYYGRLGNSCVRDFGRIETYNHDLIQMLSGQGVPPSGLEGWHSLYQEAGCELIHIYETEATDPEWFVHVVRLAGG